MSPLVGGSACIIGGMNNILALTIVAVALLFRTAGAASLPAPPFVVNCGPQTDGSPFVLAEANELREIDPTRLVHLPDVPYRATQPFGHRGGEGYWHWHGGSRPSLGPRWESDLFASGRAAPRSYSFAIPAGKYQVTIGISDGDVHVAGQRVLDILVNGRVIATDVDPIAQAGYKEPIMLSTAAEVDEDRPLNGFLSRQNRTSTDRECHLGNPSGN